MINTDYYIMDTDYQDLATATEVHNKAYQLKQVDKKWYWPLKSDIDRSGCVTSSRAHHSSIDTLRRLPNVT